MVWIQENQSLTGPRPVQSPPKQVCKRLSFPLVWLTPPVTSMTTMLPLSTTIHYPHGAGGPQNTNMPPPAPHAQKSPLVLPSACSLSSSHTSLWEWPDPWASHPLSRLMAFANAVSSNECSLPTVTSSLKPTSSSSSWRVSSSERISRISQSTNVFSAWLSLSQCDVFLHGRYSDTRYLHLTSAFCKTLLRATGANLLILLFTTETPEPFISSKLLSAYLLHEQMKDLGTWVQDFPFPLRLLQTSCG